MDQLISAPVVARLIKLLIFLEQAPTNVARAPYKKFSLAAALWVSTNHTLNNWAQAVIEDTLEY